MKLFINFGNSSALKILISANYCKKDVEIDVVDVNDPRFQKPRRLPVLETSGDFIFSSNAASYFLFPPKSEQESEVDLWLEWEAIQLQPLLLRSINTAFDSEPLCKLMDYLESSFQKQSYLVKGDLITVGDVAVWCTLYPVFTDVKLSKVFSQKFSSIERWFKALSEYSEFKVAIDKFNGPKGVECLQSISTASWYPSVTIKDLSEPSLPVQNLNISNTTPDVTKETVTDAELKEVEKSWNEGLLVKPKKRTHPVLPVPRERNVLVTSALPYVNNVPHLGNIIGCVLSADVFARYSRLRNWNTLFISGTDEYGTATETKALEEGLTPQQICDKYFKIHKETYEWFSIQFDHFGRTTTPQQTEIVQDMFKKVHSNGFTSTQEVQQLLCEKCNRFLADRFVEGTCPRCSFDDARGDQCDGCGGLINAIELINPKCKICNSTPVVRTSEHFFLDLPKVENKVRDWLVSVNDGWTHNARTISNSWLKDGLKPRCITRDLKWGIPVPLQGFEQKVFYVWFDAPIGYLSMTKCYTDQWKSWWEKDETKPVTYYQFMAKDNVPFHSIMFPSSLIAAGGKYNLVDHLIATEYLNYEDGKFSKSRGVGVFGNDAKDTGISSDIFRFYLLYMRPEGQDSIFSWVDFALKNNSELLNNLGNFINRALMFVDKFFGGVIPEMKLTKDDYTFLVYITREVKGYIKSLDKGKLRDGIKHILSLSKHGNIYMQEGKPWALIKGSDEDKIKAGTAVGLSCNLACLMALLMKPYMPQTVETICKQLNISSDLFVLTTEVMQCLKPGHKIGKPAPLFTKIEQSLVDDLKKRFAGKQQTQQDNNKKGSKNLGNNKVMNSVPTNASCISELEAAISKQGDLVRSLKSSGVPRSEWQPQVNVLLDMKKQLEAMKSSMPSISELEEKVVKQGFLVREMKASGKPKSEWQPQVNILLELKKQLADAAKS